MGHLVHSSFRPVKKSLAVSIEMVFQSLFIIFRYIFIFCLCIVLHKSTQDLYWSCALPCSVSTLHCTAKGFYIVERSPRGTKRFILIILNPQKIFINVNQKCPKLGPKPLCYVICHHQLCFRRHQMVIYQVQR